MIKKGNDIPECMPIEIAAIEHLSRSGCESPIYKAGIFNPFRKTGMSEGIIKDYKYRN